MKIEKYEIFHLVTNEDTKQCKIVLGNNLIDTCKNKEKAIQKINKKSWAMLLRVIVIIVKSITEKKEE